MYKLKFSWCSYQNNLWFTTKTVLLTGTVSIHVIYMDLCFWVIFKSPSSDILQRMLPYHIYLKSILVEPIHFNETAFIAFDNHLSWEASSLLVIRNPLISVGYETNREPTPEIHSHWYGRILIRIDRNWYLSNFTGYTRRS